MPDPIEIEVTRGNAVESRHLVAFAVTDADGKLVLSGGDIDQPDYPRSSVKAFQAIPLLESGAADTFGFDEADIALACSSHNGEPRQIGAVARMLSKAGVSETALECGADWPIYKPAADAMIKAGQVPRPIHNPCSGKHAGMLAYARHNGMPLAGYVRPDHPVQQAVEQALSAFCGVQASQAPRGIDGCSVPTWALPLRATALGFARLATGRGIGSGRAAAAARIIAAARAHPYMIAGTGRFDTDLMTAVPRVFVKSGAEGFLVASLPHAGLGIALKCLDGAPCGSTIAMAVLLRKLPIWTADEEACLANFATRPVLSRKGEMVGEIRAAP
ncbi:asparaginase [Rhodoligotrophos defluvii]|uniref:asparaginase n=1 Tax=Rhodoligotrophos defluvii TaxID=2561934 RepID=UPI0010C99330|nr:asparaginase [Rhodoligotrophos defluvii]